MSTVFQKTFGGLSKKYYIRQFLFGLIFPIFFIFIQFQSPAENQSFSTLIPLLIIMLVNSLLYPYSRFVYESTVDYILGGNRFFANILFVAVVKYITMAICWSLALVIAPIGLIYLYFNHSKNDDS